MLKTREQLSDHFAQQSRIAVLLHTPWDGLKDVPIPYSEEALPIIADYLLERGDWRADIVREMAFRKGVQERC